MADLRTIIKYIFSHYPNKNRLTKLRLLKILYLADWRSAIVRNKQLTSIKWYFGECGLVPDSAITVPEKNEFTFFAEHSSLTQEERRIIDHAMKSSSEKNWTDFISLVYSTYPILNQSSNGNNELDLIRLADLYKRMKNEQMQQDKTLFDSDSGFN